MGIDEKVEFSDEELVKEELVIPVTPVKKTMKFERVDDDNGTTVRRPHAGYNTLGTPETDPRNRERGLKKLASEAYRMVSSQRRTTYKEVARKLIGSLNDDADLEINVFVKLLRNVER